MVNDKQDIGIDEENFDIESLEIEQEVLICECGHEWINHHENYYPDNDFCLIRGCKCRNFVRTEQKNLNQFGGDKKMSKEKNNGWEKVEREIFKFEEVGDTIKGIFVKREASSQYDNETYQIKTDEGVRVVFGTTVLSQLMSSVDIGKVVKIIFIGRQPSTKEGQNDLKLFEVYQKNP